MASNIVPRDSVLVDIVQDSETVSITLGLTWIRGTSPGGPGEHTAGDGLGFAVLPEEGAALDPSAGPVVGGALGADLLRIFWLVSLLSRETSFIPLRSQKLLAPDQVCFPSEGTLHPR